MIDDICRAQRSLADVGGDHGERPHLRGGGRRFRGLVHRFEAVPPGDDRASRFGEKGSLGSQLFSEAPQRGGVHRNLGDHAEIRAHATRHRPVP